MYEIEVFPYDKEALKFYRYDGVEKDYAGATVLPIIDYYATQGDVFFGVVGNEIIGVGGMYPLWGGSGGCFLFLNKKARGYKKSVFQILSQYMGDLVKKYKIKTLIVECIGDSIKAESLIKHLGFIKNRDVLMSLYTKTLGV